MATPKKKPAKPEPLIVPAAGRQVTELLVWRAEIWPHAASRAIDFFTPDGGQFFRIAGVNDEVIDQLIAMLTAAKGPTPQPPE